MTSYVQIVSNAAKNSGGDPITSFSDPGEVAKIMVTQYEDLRDKAIREGGHWNFSRARKQLSPKSTPPAFGWLYQSTLPTDPYCLRVLKALQVGQDDNEPSEKYIVEGRTILTNFSPVNLIYASRVTNPNEFDASFLDAYTALIEARLAYPLTNSRSLAQDKYTLYERMIAGARSTDSLEGDAQEKVWGEDLFDARIL